MHEFSIMSQIFTKCLEVAKVNNASKISEINIEVGDFSLIIENFAQRAFEILKKDTLAADAKLNIKRTPGALHCNNCNQDSEIWFNLEKEKAALSGKLDEYEEYEKSIAKNVLFEKNPNLGRNIFECRKCASKDTILIKGKEILIKNIRI